MQAISEVGGELEGALGGLQWVPISFGASGSGTDSCPTESWELQGIGCGVNITVGAYISKVAMLSRVSSAGTELSASGED